MTSPGNERWETVLDIAESDADPSEDIPDVTQDQLREQWETALGICRQRLQKDYEKVAEFKSCDELLKTLHLAHKKYASKSIPQLLKNASSLISPWQSFIHAVAFALATHHTQLGIIWGLMNLFMTLSISTDTTLASIVDIIDEVGRSLQVIVEYHDPLNRNPKLDQVLVNTLVEIVIFWVHAVRFLKQPVSNMAWGDFSARQAEQMSKRIRINVTHVKDMAHAMDFQQRRQHAQRQAEIIRKIEELSLKSHESSSYSQPSPEVQLPCYHIDLPENPDFFGREDISHKVRSTLDHDQANQCFKSLALRGYGGVGKTQIALAYAYERKAKGVPAVFWINSETEHDIDRSLFNIAQRLKLIARDSREPYEKVRYYVIKWLQQSDQNWLLVCDNVEQMKVLENFWPVSTYGSILITTRPDIGSMSLLCPSFEVPSLTVHQGALYLLNSISPDTIQVIKHDDTQFTNETDLDEDVSEEREEYNMAKILASEMGGLPLALTTMAMDIKQQCISIHDFLELYREYAESQHEEFRPDVSLMPFYKHSVSTAWSYTFQNLGSEQTRHLFGILCILHSDSIPEDIFQLKSPNLLPEEMNFCRTRLQFIQAIKVLLDKALVKKEPRTRMLSVHRVIQREFRMTMESSTLRKVLRIVSRLLLNSFPKLVNGKSMRKMWPDCELYLKHVMMVHTQIKSITLDLNRPNEFSDFVQCAASASWYLREVGQYKQCLELAETALNLETNQESLLYANLLNTIAAVEHKRNNCNISFHHFKHSQDIREKLLPEDHEELANTYNNLANVHLSVRGYEEALGLYMKAISIDKKKPPREMEQILYLRYLNVANTYAFMGKHKEARDYTEAGRELAIRIFGNDSHYAGVAEWVLARIDCAERDWCSAWDRYYRYYGIQRKSNPLHSYTAAAAYRLGWVALKRKRFEDAQKYLKESLLIARYNRDSKGDNGEIARVTRKLAECAFYMGNSKKGESLSEIAENMRKELQDDYSGEYDDNDQSYDMLVSYFHR